jgi:hypothetical protein
MTHADWLALAAAERRAVQDLAVECVLLRLLLERGIRERTALQARVESQQRQIRQLLGVEHGRDAEDDA